MHTAIGVPTTRITTGISGNLSESADAGNETARFGIFG